MYTWSRIKDTVCTFMKLKNYFFLFSLFIESYFSKISINLYYIKFVCSSWTYGGNVHSIAINTVTHLNSNISKTKNHRNIVILHQSKVYIKFSLKWYIHMYIIHDHPSEYCKKFKLSRQSPTVSCQGIFCPYRRWLFLNQSMTDDPNNTDYTSHIPYLVIELIKPELFGSLFTFAVKKPYSLFKAVFWIVFSILLLIGSIIEWSQ